MPFDVPGVGICPHCGGRSEKQGHNPSGTQRRRCVVCRRSWTPFPADLVGHKITVEQERSLRLSFSRQRDLHEAARRAGVSAMTAHRVYHEIGRPGLCRCGRPWNHKGSCIARRRKRRTKRSSPEN